MVGFGQMIGVCVGFICLLTVKVSIVAILGRVGAFIVLVRDWRSCNCVGGIISAKGSSAEVFEKKSAYGLRALVFSRVIK